MKTLEKVLKLKTKSGRDVFAVFHGGDFGRFEAEAKDYASNADWFTEKLPNGRWRVHSVDYQDVKVTLKNENGAFKILSRWPGNRPGSRGRLGEPHIGATYTVPWPEPES